MALRTGPPDRCDCRAAPPPAARAGRQRTRREARSGRSGRASSVVSRALRREPLDRPGLPFAAIAKAVVHAVFAVLPELVRVGREAETSPRLGPRHLDVREFALELRVPRLELVAIGEDLALPGRDRRKLCASRPRVEVLLALRRRDARDITFDSHLPTERIPVEEERSPWILREL